MIWQRRIFDFLEWRQRPRCMAVLVVVGFVFSVEDSSRCNAADARFNRRREAFAIDRDSAASRRIADIREYIRRKRWPQTAELLIRLSTERGKSLVPFQAGWSISVSRYCNLLAAALPAQGLREYRAKMDTRAAGWLQDARKTPGDDLLRRIVREAFCSKAGDDALMLLGQRAWDRGDVPTARRCWSLLIRPQATGESTGRLFYPDSGFDQAGIHARVILCHIVQREFRRADQRLAEFKKRFPKSTGRIAGRQGLLVDILTAFRKREQKWPQSKATGSHLTFAGRTTRNDNPVPLEDVGAPRWSRQLFWRRPKLPDFSRPVRIPRHAAVFPVVYRGRVYLSDEDRIYGLNLKTGMPAFPGEKNAKQSIEMRSVLYSVPAEKQSPQPLNPSIGVPYYSLTIRDGRLFARMGSPITGRSQGEGRAVRSHLVCLDLDEAEGRIVWKTESSLLGTGWEFEGAPVVKEDRLFVAMRRRHPETEIYVGCFDPTTGKPIWKSRVGTAIGGAADGINVVTRLLLTLAEGRLFLSTNHGAVAALDARDGRMEWVITYPSVVPVEKSDLSDPRKVGVTPCLFHNGRLFVAPSDSDHVFAIDAESGSPLWDRKIRGGIRNLIGAIDGTLAASGNQLWGLTTATGKVRWTAGSRDPTGFGFARGTLAGGKIYWPLRKEILVVQTTVGRIVRRISLRNLRGGSGGNLVIVQGMLVVAEPDRIVVYGPQPGRRRANRESSAARTK